MNNSHERIVTGLELEGFAFDQSGQPIDVLGATELLAGFPSGSWTSDAGLNQLELINPHPHLSYLDAVAEITALSERLPAEWFVKWTARLPGHVSGEPVAWATKERYRVMHQALAEECPGAWHTVKQMAAWSALHVNVAISPWSPAGLLVMNAINNIGPYIGHMVREEFPESRGHLMVWRGWAREERLPRYEDFFTSHDHLAAIFERLPRLIQGKFKNSGPWSMDLKHQQSISSSGDLCAWWKLARPKRSRRGSYLELRVLPSMPPSALERYVGELLRGVAALLSWSEASGNCRVMSQAEMAPALKVAARASRLFPSTPLTRDEWEKYFTA
jgi:hypothetical protein